MELHEVTICEKGINPEATFRILKEDTTMSNETNALGELSEVLDRLNKKLDTMENGSAADDVAKEMPDFLKPKDDEEGKDSKDKDSEKNGDEDKMNEKEEKSYGSDMEKESEDEKKDKKEDMEKSGYSDVITSDYLNWMESTLKGQGVDIGDARNHFENLEKAQLGGYQSGGGPENGQTKNRESEGGNPSTGALSRAGLSSGGKVKKSDFLAPNNVSASEIEAAYEVFKAAALEEQFKSSLNSVFTDRLSKEQVIDRDARAASSFDARAPLGEIQKALANLGNRIDSLSSNDATPIMKSAGNISKVEIPTSDEMASMDWSDVHQLAGSVWN